MGELSKQLAIYISLFLCCAPYTMIATFFPKIATEKGLSLWLIGFVFSADPLCGIITSSILGKYMMRIGRKFTIVLSLLLSSFSMIVLSPIELCDSEIVIILSFGSRILAGMSAGCVMTAGDSVFMSDYPDDIEKMIGRMEGSIGIGLIVGPLIGALLYLENLFYSLIVFGVAIFLFIPLCWKLLGNFRDYEIENKEMSSFELLSKFVINIQKITLDLGMNTALLFSFGFLIPILELHLLSFNLSHTAVAFCFILETSTYSFFSFFGSKIFNKLDERTTLFIGTMLLGFTFLMVSPWQVIFPKSLWIVLLSLPIMGVAQAMIYRKLYLVPTYPHMIKCAHETYNYAKDDVLIDTLSGLSNIACNIGEIIGPLFTGIVSHSLGIESCGAIIAFCYFAYGIVYLFGSGLFHKWQPNKKSEVLHMKMIAAES